MPKYRLLPLLKGLLLGVSLWSVAAEAIQFSLNNRATPRISIRVGNAGNKISVVTFTIPASQLANGTAISGSSTIRIQLDIRSSAANPLTGFLTVDSVSNPLKNTAPGSTSTIPFSEVSWTAQDGDIPSGSYQGIQDQAIVNLQSSQRYRDFHSFSYANSLDIESGTYEGRVIYTWAVP